MCATVYKRPDQETEDATAPKSHLAARGATPAAGAGDSTSGPEDAPGGALGDSGGGVSDAACDRVIAALDEYGREYDPESYGLPVYSPAGADSMRAIVRRALAGPSEPDAPVTDADLAAGVDAATTRTARLERELARATAERDHCRSQWTVVLTEKIANAGAFGYPRGQAAARAEAIVSDALRAYRGAAGLGPEGGAP